jgi:hypothetical protein
MTGTHGSEGAPAGKPAGATRLSEDHVRADQADPGDLIEPGHRGRERGSLGGDPVIQRGDIGADRVDPPHHRAQQEPVVVSEVTGEGLLQDSDLGAHAAPGQLRQHLRVPLPGNQRRQHVAAGDPEDVRDDRADLDAGFSELCEPSCKVGMWRQVAGGCTGTQGPPRPMSKIGSEEKLGR